MTLMTFNPFNLCSFFHLFNIAISVNFLLDNEAKNFSGCRRRCKKHKIKTQHQTTLLFASTENKMQRHSHKLLINPCTHFFYPSLEWVSRVCMECCVERTRVETLHNALTLSIPLFVSFVLCILFSSSHYMQIKWRWKCDINDNRHWNETMVEWETEMRCKNCDSEENEKEMWHENYWENSHCLPIAIYTTTTTSTLAIKYLQFTFIVELIVKWEFHTSSKHCNIILMSDLTWESICEKLLRFREFAGNSTSAEVIIYFVLRFPKIGYFQILHTR
jgi:hypothetical protein